MVVDPGGNWLRISSPREDDGDTGATSELDLVLRAAARHGDVRGEPETAISMLAAGLQRHVDAQPRERLPALVYLAELQVRVGRTTDANETVRAIRALELDAVDRAELRDLLAAAEEIAEAP